MPKEDIDRVQRRLNQIWEIGKTDSSGVTRLAYTSEENVVFDYLRDELPREFDVWTDSVGNLFATPWPEAENSLYIGSHLDSVINGGRLDGVLGVITALEAIQTLHESSCQPPNPPTLAVFRGEESARFGQHTIGSRTALGMLTVEDFSATDQNDVPLWHAMQQAGFHPENLSEPTIDLDRVTGFLEVHIEQGRVLDESDDDLGVVTNIRAPVRYKITVEGAYDHSGATPMNLRHDALAGASAIILAIQRVGKEADNEGDLVATVGDITAVDGAINKVCGEVSFPLDIRSVNEAFRDQIESRILEEIRMTADQHNLQFEVQEIDRSSPVTMSEEIASQLAHAADSSESGYRFLPSGGGHDTMNFQQAGVPAGLLFVPSVDGVSHSPDEETYDDAVAAAVQTLIRFTLSEIEIANKKFTENKIEGNGGDHAF
ncbi:Zn-dependent hydrolase [Halococcus thailandensis]|nr:Zn-dependent hydrolase [Halococcus thailandensis]